MKIDKDFSFGSKIEQNNLINYKGSLSYYYDNFSKTLDLDKKIPIFLDTNVLLQIYKLSFKARNKLSKFFSANKEYIFITHQIQKEFIKHREHIIDDFFLEATSGLPKNFKSSTINSIKEFLDKNKDILIDYHFVEDKLNKIIKECNTLLTKLENEVNENTKIYKNKDIIYKDEFLDLISNLNILTSLGADELEFLRKEFDDIKKSIKDLTKIKTEIEQPFKAFPGMADLLEKQDNPYGDYFIFHEMLKYVKENNTDCIFLTHDITKGDWMTKEKQPHLHYINNIFLNTGKSIFILDALRFFEDKLDISFKSVVREDFSNHSEADFIAKVLFLWSKFEGITRSLNILKDATQSKFVAPSFKLFEILYRLEVFTKEEYYQIREIGSVRNRLAHGEIVNFTEEDQLKIIAKIEYYIEKVSAIK